MRISKRRDEQNFLGLACDVLARTLIGAFVLERGLLICNFFSVHERNILIIHIHPALIMACLHEELQFLTHMFYREVLKKGKDLRILSQQIYCILVIVVLVY